MTANNEKASNRRWWVIAAVAFGIGLLVFVAAGWIADARDADRPTREDTLPLVETAEVRPMPQVFEIEEEGFLRPRAEIELVPEIAGRVVEVSPQLEPGGRFEKGEVMFKIDPRTFEADLARAEADLQAARAGLERATTEAARQERLAEIGATASARSEQAVSELASARARIGQAEAAVTSSRKALEDTTVTAPFAASVIEENVALGRFVQPGAVVATIFDTAAGEVVLDLLPEDARAVRLAAAESEGPLHVEVSPSDASATGATLDGIVKRFGQSVDRQTRTVPLVVEVPGAFSEENDALVFANDFVTVTIPARAPDPLFAAPLGTVRGETSVWILDEDNRLRGIEVTPVKRTEREVIFRAARDLTDQRVVITPLTEEAEGLEVLVAEPTTRTASRGSERP
ncbi:MAG: efflux RND transporter periplasmic adaptor subunit [Parvularcula sp.]|jgi:RND family efflux transporter MFP subunit|nr:efflux RND transporter periplasmic adaptor subunit [Parvularcula sp.]